MLKLVVISYAMLTNENAKLYIEKSKLNDEVLKHLGAEVQIFPYEQIFDDIKSLNLEKKVLSSHFTFLILEYPISFYNFL
jgi:Xaa-Pro aminopeptidase